MKGLAVVLPLITGVRASQASERPLQLRGAGVMASQAPERPLQPYLLQGFNGLLFAHEPQELYYGLLYDTHVKVNVRFGEHSEGAWRRRVRSVVSCGLVASNHRLGVFHAAEACHVGFAEACAWAAHEIAVVLDEELLALGQTKSRDMEVTVMHLPAECKFLPGDAKASVDSASDAEPTAAWERRMRRRRLNAPVVGSLVDWISYGAVAGAPDEANLFTNQCKAQLKGLDLAARRYDGKLSTILVKTPTLKLRIEAWGYDRAPEDGGVPVALEVYPQGWVPTEKAHGLLGQTVRHPGLATNKTMDGVLSDYVVDGPYAQSFVYFD